VTYWSRDPAGNVEVAHTLTVPIDQTPPVTSTSLSGPPGDHGWYIGPVTITLAAGDNLSGVAATRFRLDGGTWQPYTGALTVSSEARHSLDFASTDAAGNVEAAPTLAILIDQTPPELDVIQTDPPTLWPPDGKLVPVTVTVRTADLGAGLDPDTPATFTVADEYRQVEPSGHFVVSDNGTYKFTVLLEARRDGKDQDGRHYTITITDRDLAGHRSSGAIEIVVPHDQRVSGRSAAGEPNDGGADLREPAPVVIAPWTAESTTSPAELLGVIGPAGTARRSRTPLSPLLS
jgi:hypothetical protein